MTAGLIIGRVATQKTIVTEERLRAAQTALLRRQLSAEDIALIDALISHVVCERPILRFRDSMGKRQQFTATA